MMLQLLYLIVAWISAVYGIWTGEDRLHKRKCIASGIASVALLISIVTIVSDHDKQIRNDRIHEQQIYAMTPIQKIKVIWAFENVPENIMGAFSNADQEDREFWELFDYIDTPDMDVTKGLRVEHLVQPLINAIASGDTVYPFRGEVNPRDHGVQEGLSYQVNHHLLFPLNISLNERITLGTLTSDSERKSFEEYYEVVPYPAPAYAYSADAEQTDTGFVLQFGETLGAGNTTAPPLTGFNIILVDNADELISAENFFEPDSQKNYRINSEFEWANGASWRQESKLTMIINEIEDKPLNFDVTYVGRYIHAPEYTDEDLPYAEYIFTVYRCGIAP